MKTFSIGTLFYLAMAVVVLIVQGCPVEKKSEVKPSKNKKEESRSVNSENIPNNSPREKDTQLSSEVKKGDSKEEDDSAFNGPSTLPSKPTDAGNDGPSGSPLSTTIVPKANHESQSNEEDAEKEEKHGSNLDFSESQLKNYSDIIKKLSVFHAAFWQLEAILVKNRTLVDDAQISGVYSCALAAYDEVDPDYTRLWQLKESRSNSSEDHSKDLHEVLPLFKVLGQCINDLNVQQLTTEMEGVLKSQKKRYSDIIEKLSAFRVAFWKLEGILEQNDTLKDDAQISSIYSCALAAYDKVEPNYTDLCGLKEKQNNPKDSDEELSFLVKELSCLAALDQCINGHNNIDIEELTTGLNNAITNVLQPIKVDGSNQKKPVGKVNSGEQLKQTGEQLKQNSKNSPAIQSDSPNQTKASSAVNSRSEQFASDALTLTPSNDIEEQNSENSIPCPKPKSNFKKLFGKIFRWKKKK